MTPSSFSPFNEVAIPFSKPKVIYSASLGQMVEGHTALTELSITKGWIKPYSPSVDQLTCAYNESKSVINENK